MYCFAILVSTSIVIHSVKQRLLRNRPGSDAANSRDFLRERLQREFTRANQLHRTAQYESVPRWSGYVYRLSGRKKQRKIASVSDEPESAWTVDTREDADDGALSLHGAAPDLVHTVKVNTRQYDGTLSLHGAAPDLVHTVKANTRHCL